MKTVESKATELKTVTFAELPLHPDIQKVLAEENYITPTPIQAQAIPPVAEGRDVLGTAQTGTGKTAAFALPILSQIHEERRSTQPHAPMVLILSPTRELASQIGESLQTYGRHTYVRTAVIFGGVGQGPQVHALRRGVHILVATPGRLQDLMSQGHIRLDKVEVLILDEADQMCDMGFLPDLKRIVAKLPEERQSLFFSATMPPAVADFAHSLLTDPVRVSVAPQSTTTERVEQRVLMMPNSAKRETLERMLEDNNFSQVLVFVRTKRRAEIVAKQLSQADVTVDAIHGDKTQAMRTRALLAFRTNRIRVLVATDVAARGLDIDGISHVINYDMPVDPESYVHRIGRTGRAGSDGIAVTFCTPEDHSDLRLIEKTIKLTIEKKAIAGASLPTPEAERLARGPSNGGNRRGPRHQGGGGPRRPQPQRPQGEHRPASRNGEGRPAQGRSTQGRPGEGRPAQSRGGENRGGDNRRFENRQGSGGRSHDNRQGEGRPAGERRFDRQQGERPAAGGPRRRRPAPSGAGR